MLIAKVSLFVNKQTVLIHETPLLINWLVFLVSEEGKLAVAIALQVASHVKHIEVVALEGEGGWQLAFVIELVLAKHDLSGECVDYITTRGQEVASLIDRLLALIHPVSAVVHDK